MLFGLIFFYRPLFGETKILLSKLAGNKSFFLSLVVLTVKLNELIRLTSCIVAISLSELCFETVMGV